MSNTPYYYLDVLLYLNKTPEELLPVYFKSKINQILHKIFGEIGGHTQIDILKFSKTLGRAIIRVPENYYIKLRAALTLISTFQDIPCYFKVLCASNCLLALSDSIWNWD